MKVILSFLFLLLFSFYTNSQINEVVQTQNILYTKINVLKSDINGDTLEIVTDDKIIWKPFATEISVNNLQNIHGHIYSIKENEFVTLSYETSKIVLKKNQLQTNLKIVYVSIFSPEIKLQYGIRVGMSKVEFFELLNFSSDIINKTSVVKFYDPPGDLIEQSFIFKNGFLHLIEMKSIYNY